MELAKLFTAYQEVILTPLQGVIPSLFLRNLLNKINKKIFSQLTRNAYNYNKIGYI